MSEEETIKAPLENLEIWREDNVPEEVWENEYLQAYLESRRTLVRIAIATLGFVAFMAGYYFRG